MMAIGLVILLAPLAWKDVAMFVELAQVALVVGGVCLATWVVTHRPRPSRPPVVVHVEVIRAVRIPQQREER